MTIRGKKHVSTVMEREKFGLTPTVTADYGPAIIGP
jgi:hypothetical protein